MTSEHIVNNPSINYINSWHMIDLWLWIKGRLSIIKTHDLTMCQSNILKQILKTESRFSICLQNGQKQ